MTETCNVYLQEAKYREALIGKGLSSHGNHSELYFKEADMRLLLKSLKPFILKPNMQIA